MKARKLLLLFFIFTYNLLFAQKNNIKFELISDKEGLSHSHINSIIQDHKGYIWFGTWDGLNRYDGYTMKVYRHSHNEINSISDNFITRIYEDRAGVIWVGTRQGLNKFDRSKEHFISYKNDPNNPESIPSNLITSIFQDSDGDLWIGASNNLTKFIEKDNKFIVFKTFNFPGGLRTIVEHPKSIFWIATYEDGLYKFNKIENSFTHYLHDPSDRSSLSHNNILDICKNTDNKLWIATYGGGLDLFNPETEIFQHFKNKKNNPNSLSTNKILSICMDHSGYLWIGTDNYGIDIFDITNNKFTHIKKSANSISNLSYNIVKYIYEDKNGIIWAGTYGGGINKYNNANKNFVLYQHDPYNTNSISGNIVESILEDQQGILWISIYEEGINRFDRKNNKFTQYKHDPNNDKSISCNSIWDICEDQNGTLWFGGMKVLNKLDKKTNTFKRYPIQEESFHIIDVYEDKMGYLWLGTLGNGIYKFDKKTGKYINYRNNPNNNKSLKSNHILTIYEDSYGVFWIGTQKALEIFDRKNETFTHFTPNNNPNSLSYNLIHAIYEDQEKNLWIGTGGGGLNLFQRETQTFLYLDEKDGLSNNSVLGILEENTKEKGKAGNLWLSTNKGISKFNQKNKTFSNYYVEDGLQGNAFRVSVYFKSKSGEMFFGGKNGFNAFFPDSIKDNLNIPEVVITDLKIFNKSVKIGEKFNTRIILCETIEETKEITLSHKESMFSLDFAALHFSSPYKNSYAYKLEGFHEDWIFTDATRNTATFTKLDPGSYTFNVIASNNDGIWNKKGASLKINILAPFWKTFQFKIITIIVALLFIYTLWIIRIKAIKHQKFILEKLVEKRTTEIKDKNEELRQQNEEIETQRDALADANVTKDKYFSIISHELKNPFNALLGFSEILAENAMSLTKEKVQVYSNQLSNSVKILYSLIDNLLSWSRIKTNRINCYPENIDIHTLIKNCFVILNKNAKKKNIILESNIKQNTFAYADSFLISTVLRNLISNAIKFSEPENIISVTCKSHKKYIEIFITDSGIGISKKDMNKLFREDVHFTTLGTNKEKGTGLGLIICKDFIERSKGKIRVKSEPEKGSTFCFTLPKPS